NPVISVRPRAIPPNIRARCEIDLSPGTVSSPQARPPGAARYLSTSDHRPGIRAEDAEQRGALLQLLERLGDIRVLGVPLDVDEEDIVPFLAMGGTRFDPGHADPVLG